VLGLRPFLATRVLFLPMRRRSLLKILLTMTKIGAGDLQVALVGATLFSIALDVIA